MNQEQMMLKMKDMSKLTGEGLLKALLFMLENGRDQLKAHQANKSFTGETQWNKIMATNAPKELKQFRSNELNLERLKSYLNERGVAFAFRQQKDGKMEFVFESKNKQIVEEVFKELINDLTDTKKVQNLNKMLLKTPKNMGFEDKLDYYKQRSAQEIKEKLAKSKSIKAPKKAKEKGELSK
ncbi:DUF3801 domain-containing protein [Streptococcus uberis]|uniref:DUF3801 domain-containing protein n=1 Tax=Streptococcus uberis TaxID=1349 RepID=UPI0020BF3DED|nr:DUF3801 domain-containing protein [Streptococcus uberis]